MAVHVKVGDAVHLKGGSPRMTVTQVETDAGGFPTVRCSWFVGNEAKSESFPADALKIAEPIAGGGGGRVATGIDFDF